MDRPHQFGSVISRLLILFPCEKQRDINRYAKGLGVAVRERVFHAPSWPASPNSSNSSTRVASRRLVMRLTPNSEPGVSRRESVIQKDWCSDSCNWPFATVSVYWYI